MEMAKNLELPRYQKLRGSPTHSPSLAHRAAEMMAPLTKRKRFIFLVGVCCVSLLAFGWYTKRDSDFSFTDFIPYPQQANTRTDLDDSSTQTISKPKSIVNPKQNLVQNDDIDDLEYDGYDEGVFKPLTSQDYDLNSGPTQSSKVATTQNINPHTGPTTSKSDGEDGVTGPTTSKPDGEDAVTGPTTSKPDGEDAVTGPTTSKPDGEEGVTGPTESTAGPQVTPHAKTAGLLIDTPGCKIPKLDPWDPTIKGLYEAHDKLVCEGPPLFMTPQPNGIIALNETVLKTHYDISRKELYCSYKTIKRKHEEPGNVRENDYIVEEPKPMTFDVPMEEDYVEVNCLFGNSSSKTFQQFFPLVRLRKEIEEERNAINPPESRLNVILAGVDSVSKLNFLRHFKRTHEFLKTKLKPFEMKGYTKVGDNTFPNLVPLLTGHFVEYYWNESLRDTMYFDSIDLIWKDYAKKGYRTFYAEDSPFTGTFNYIKKGFYDPPTDYYFRPLALAMEGSNIREHSSSHCYNSQLETDIIYDFLKDFLKTMDYRPYIGFAMVSTMTHDYLNNAAYADDPTARLLENLYESGALNTSMLVLFSDHGLRFGAIRETYIGKFEERMPFMYVHVPEWFLEKHPEVAKNLNDNQERLITLFDIHATMIHLLDINHVMTPEEKANITMGTSLMGEISTDRTCNDANILPHWCPCQTMEPVPLDGVPATKSAEAMMDSMNAQLSSYQDKCAKLEVEKISDARLGLANELVMTFVRHENVVENRKVVYGDRVNPLEDYMITLTAKPGGGVFEGTVRHDTTKDSYSVLGISRINMYGNSSWCIDSQKMKIYCYCNS